MVSDQDFLNLKNAFEEFVAEYRHNRFSALEIKEKDTKFNGKVGFWVDPVDRPETIADPTDAGGVYNQTVAQSAVDAIKALIDRLQELGLIK